MALDTAVEPSYALDPGSSDWGFETVDPLHYPSQFPLYLTDMGQG